MKLSDFIKDNYKTIDKLTKSGIVSTSLKSQFEMNEHFNNSKHIKSRMQKYENTAETMGVSSETVRKAVRKMNRRV